MASPTVDKILPGNLVMHDHSADDLGTTLDSRYVNVSGDTMTGTLLLSTLQSATVASGISLAGTNATSGNDTGANITITAGSGFGSGQGGNFVASGNDGGATGNGGTVEFQSGNGGATSGNGGDIIFTAGAGQAGNGNGGTIQFVAGTPDGSGAAGKYYFYNELDQSFGGILSFNNIATTDKTFTFPNTTGTIALLETANAFTTNNTIGGYLGIGSVSAPSNTTAGDLTALRLHVGTDATQGTNLEADFNGDLGIRRGLNLYPVAAGSTTLNNATLTSGAFGFVVDSNNNNNLTITEKTISTTTARLNMTHSGDMLHTGYLRVGSLTAPTNTTAGDLTFVRGFGSGATTLDSLTLTTDLAVLDGGTGASDAATARTNLGLVAGGTGDIWVEKAGDAVTGAITITTAVASNAVPLTIAQNDTTNDPSALVITSATNSGTNNALDITSANGYGAKITGGDLYIVGGTVTPYVTAGGGLVLEPYDMGDGVTPPTNPYARIMFNPEKATLSGSDMPDVIISAHRYHPDNSLHRHLTIYTTDSAGDPQHRLDIDYLKDIADFDIQNSQVIISGIMTNNAANYRGLVSSITFDGSGAGAAAVEASPTHSPSGSISTAYGLINLTTGTPATDAVITSMYSVYTRVGTGAAAGSSAITNAYGQMIENPSLGTLKPGAITGIRVNNQGETGVATCIGLDVQATTGADTTNIGVRIAKGDTYALQLSDTGGTAPGGITFGTDANLYRSTTATLKTDNKLIIADTLSVTPTTSPLVSATFNGTIAQNSNNSRSIKINPTYTGSGAGQAGLEVSPVHQPSATVSVAYGFINITKGQPDTGVTITALHAGFNRIDSGSLAGSIGTSYSQTLAAPSFGTQKPTTTVGLNVLNQGSASVTTTVGVDIAAQTASTTTIGLRIGTPTGTTSYALQLSGTGGTAASGITFGTDTTLYRPAADTLKTDDALIVTGALTPAANDGAALGSSSVSWSDLFLASGGVIDFNNGDVTITHSSNTLAIAGGDVSITAASMLFYPTNVTSDPTLFFTNTVNDVSADASIGFAIKIDGSNFRRWALGVDNTADHFAIGGGLTDSAVLGTNDRFLITQPKTLTDAATSLFEVALAAGTMAGGTIFATIEATDGTDHQAFTQVITWSVVNKAGVYTKTVTVDTANDAKAVSTGTLTATWAFLDGTNKVTMQVTPAGSLTETTYRVRTTILNNSPQAITVLT